MKSVLVNGVDCPVLKVVDGLPVITLRGHNGQIASSVEDTDKVMFDGISFWCPVELVRVSVGEENIRVDAPTEEEVERIKALIQARRDIGVIKIVSDQTDQKHFRVLDGNTRYPLFLSECDPSHVFAEYKELSDNELEAMSEQVVSNVHSLTTKKSSAFQALRGQLLTNDLPTNTQEGKDEKDRLLAVLYADAGGKGMFLRHCARAKNSIPELWEAFNQKKITIASLDSLARLINVKNGAILVDLQKQELKIAIDQNLPSATVQTRVDTALMNWDVEWQESQKPKVEAVEESDDETYGIAKPQAASRPQSTANPSTSAKKVPPAPKAVAVAPAKVTAAQMAQKKQETKSTKGQGGVVKHAAKVITNAPAVVIAAKEPISDVRVDVYQPLLDVEEFLVRHNLVSSNGACVPKNTASWMERYTLSEIQDVLAQIAVIRAFLSTVDEIASSVESDIKEKASAKSKKSNK